MTLLPLLSIRRRKPGHPAAFLPAFLLLAMALPSQADPVRDGNVSAELVAELSHVTPGEPFTVAVRLAIDPGWHTYWINPGDAGFPTSVDWSLPEGFTAGELTFTYPHRFEVDFDGVVQVGLGYETSAVHLVEITPPSDLATGSTVSLAAKVSWLMCDDKSCVPGSADVTLEIPVSADPGTAGPEAALFAQARKEAPVPAPAWTAGIEEIDDQKVRITITPPADAQLPDLASLRLYPEAQYVIDFKSPQEFQEVEGSLVMTLPKHEYADALPSPFAAVLITETGFPDFDDLHAIRVTDAPPASDTQVDSPAPETGPVDPDTAKAGPSADNAPFGGGLLGYLIAGFIGGMILNIMPCVFPVISLKILSFVSHAGDDRKKALAHGLVYTLGILLFFLALAVIVTSLSLGWGGQFQSPVFVMVMAAVIFVLSLSLFGVFEFGVKLTSVGGGLTQASGYAGSFWSGALAVILATPCTGPFLGTSLGWAFSQPPTVIFVFFVMMGLGMAAPYVLLTVFPALTNRLPRPGPWMETFKQVMGFPMMAAVVYMLWILEGQIGDKGQAWFMGALILLGLGAWAWGRFGGPTVTGTRKNAAMATIAVSLIGAVGLSLFATQQGSSASEPGNGDRPIAEIIEEHRAAGKHVFVDFTARWCAICQTNKPAMYSEETKSNFEEYGVVFVVADWTNKSEDIFQFLQKYGRRSVPFYPLFPADQSRAPLELPQNLTNGIILDYVKQLDDVEGNFPVATN